MNIIITIPALNEQETIGQVITDIHNVMKSTKYKYKVQVVDDGSKDNTKKVAEQAGALVYSHPINLGLAETFRTEIQKALENKADVIVHTDADGQYQAKDIPRLIHEIENGYDLVLGNRFVGGIETMPLMKRIGNKAFSKVISKIIGHKIGDCQTGFRAFTRALAENIQIISDHTYTQEQIIKAVRKKFRVKEIPTYFSKRISGDSRLLKNPFEYAIKAWLNIVRIYRDYDPLKFFIKIGLVFLVPGVLIGLWLVSIFIRTGSVLRIPFAILSILLILLGVQIILFGLLSDMIKR